MGADNHLTVVPENSKRKYDFALVFEGVNPNEVSPQEAERIAEEVKQVAFEHGEAVGSALGDVREVTPRSWRNE